MCLVRSFPLWFDHQTLLSTHASPVWDVAAEDEVRTRANAIEKQRGAAQEMQKRREEIRRHSIDGQ